MVVVRCWADATKGLGQRPHLPGRLGVLQVGVDADGLAVDDAGGTLGALD